MRFSISMLYITCCWSENAYFIRYIFLPDLENNNYTFIDLTNYRNFHVRNNHKQSITYEHSRLYSMQIVELCQWMEERGFGNLESGKSWRKSHYNELGSFVCLLLFTPQQQFLSYIIAVKWIKMTHATISEPFSYLIGVIHNCQHYHEHTNNT